MSITEILREKSCIIKIQWNNWPCTARDDNEYNQIKEEDMIKVESVYFEILGCTWRIITEVSSLYIGKVALFYRGLG